MELETDVTEELDLGASSIVELDVVDVAPLRKQI